MNSSDPHVIVLIAATGSGALPAEFARATLFEAAPDAPTGGFRVLSPGTAAELAVALDASQAAAIGRQVAAALAQLPIDVGVVPAANRRKRLLVADMDSTIIGQECIDEMADLVGRMPEVATITERAMSGEIDFAAALRDRVAVLAGLDLARVRGLLASRITLNPGARQLTATMRAHGGHAALVSGGFTLFTQAIAARAGFNEDHANKLELDGDRLTGRIVPPILGREAKLSTLLAVAAACGVSLADALTVGDGANDLAMIEAADEAGGLGVAYHAKPAVAARAGVSLRHADLVGLLYLQGYADSEIAQ